MANAISVMALLLLCNLMLGIMGQKAHAATSKVNLRASVLRTNGTEYANNGDVPVVTMELFHIHHPSSPFKIQGATPAQEFQALLHLSAAHVQRLIRPSNSETKNPSIDLSDEKPDVIANDWVLPGLPAGSGAFYTEIKVGTPGLLNNFIIDTGSDLTWLQCKPCTNCYEQGPGPQGPIPIFDPSLSSTFKNVECPSPLCSLLPFNQACPSNRLCTYNVSYADTTYSAGTLSVDTFNMGNVYNLFGVAFGCSHDTAPEPSFGSGLVGFGAGKFSLPSQAQKGLFFCLPHGGRPNPKQGFIGLGKPAEGPNAVHTKLLRSAIRESNFFVPLSGISIDGKAVPMQASDLMLKPDGSGGVVLDTGTFPTILPPMVYTAFRDAVRAAVAGRHVQLPEVYTVGPFDTCYNFPGGASANNTPTVDLHFDGVTGGAPISISLPPENVMSEVPQLGNVIHCLAFMIPPAGLDLSILASTQLAGFQVIIDTSAASTVSFSPSGCP